MSKRALGHRSTCRMIGYRFEVALPHENAIDETDIERALERGVRAGVVAPGQFDTGRGRFVWFNGWPGAALRRQRDEVVRLIAAARRH